MDKEFRLEVKIRNNRLLKSKEESGLRVPEFCEAAGIPRSHWHGYTSMRMSPITEAGEWKDSAIRLSAFCGLQLEELFPDAVLAVEKNFVQLEVGAEEVQRVLSMDQPLMGDQAEAVDLRIQIKQAISALEPREEAVLKLLFGIDVHEHTVDEVAKLLGVSSSRVNSISSTAMRRLRYGRRGRALRDFGYQPLRLTDPEEIRFVHFKREHGCSLDEAMRQSFSRDQEPAPPRKKPQLFHPKDGVRIKTDSDSIDVAVEGIDEVQAVIKLARNDYVESDPRRYAFEDADKAVEFFEYMSFLYKVTPTRWLRGLKFMLKVPGRPWTYHLLLRAPRPSIKPSSP